MDTNKVRNLQCHLNHVFIFQWFYLYSVFFISFANVVSYLTYFICYITEPCYLFSLLKVYILLYKYKLKIHMLFSFRPSCLASL